MPPNRPPNGEIDPPVEPAEFLLRRFASAPDQFDHAGKFPRIGALLPTKNDADGLSLFREGDQFVTPARLLELALNPRVRQYGGVLAILALRFRELGLSIVPRPTEIPGHVVIPEMNRVDYDAAREHKNRIHEWADRLVRAAKDDVRIWPTPIP